MHCQHCQRVKYGSVKSIKVAHLGTAGVKCGHSAALSSEGRKEGKLLGPSSLPKPLPLPLTRVLPLPLQLPLTVPRVGDGGDGGLCNA